jgi:hypothetical protein
VRARHAPDAAIRLHNIEHGTIRHRRQRDMRDTLQRPLVVERRSERRARLCQKSLVRFPSHLNRCIAQNNRKQPAAGQVEASYRCVGRKLAAIVPQAKHLPPLTHPPRDLRRLGERPDVARMHVAETLWNQDVQRLADDVLGVPTKDHLGAVIERDDLLIVVDRNDCIGRQVDDAFVPAERLTERTLNVFAVTRPTSSPQSKYQ